MPRGRPKGSKKGMQTKQVPLQYDSAETVEELAKELIRDYHTHLINKKIKYLFVNKPIKRQGQIVAATAEKISKKVAAISDNIEFLIVVSYPIYNDLSDELKRYVIDHELSHCFIDDPNDDGEEKNMLLPHDFEDFISIVERYGPIREEIRKLNEVLKELNSNV